MIISRTPLRVSLVGGGTDLQQFYKTEKGQVISFSINKYIYVIVKERFDNLIVLNYTQHEIVSCLDDIKHDLIRECCRVVGIKNSIEISTMADIPSQGSGLGSSSSVTVGLLNALFQYKNIPVTQEFLARTACEIEINILKNPIGKQDQFIAAYGGFNKFIFERNDNVLVQSFNLDKEQILKIGSNLLLHFTDQTRNASKILKTQSKNVSKKIRELKALSHLVEKLEVALKNNKYSTIGDLLKSNWELKKTLSDGITSEYIEKMVSVAMNNGSIGCKISGAGGGGFLLSYVNRNNQDNFRKAMQNYRELPFMIDPYGSRIILNIQ
jgi:D-glycero-alpha-D-manno-heptose-7-phosphate kinase